VSLRFSLAEGNEYYYFGKQKQQKDAALPRQLHGTLIRVTRPNVLGTRHGTTFTGTQLPAMPSFSRILGSSLSPGLFGIQDQKQKAAQPCGFPGHRPTLPGL